jgi:dihydrodipicolinate synthase/N-acetylneuraminate lyase
MKKPVVGIPVAFKSEKNVDIGATLEYCLYLKDKGASRIMTTAGTSTFNLLSLDEIHSLNTEISKINCETFLGLPALSLNHTIEMIKKCNQDYSENTNLILLFPERYYSNDQIINYFIEIADYSRFPIYIHGKTMRKGFGGNYDYCKNVLNTLSLHDNIAGMKEEHSNLNSSFNELSSIDGNFESIVAGGSMRRFMFLNAAGASSFLSGVGNINPKIENDFYNHVINGNLDESNNIISKYETPMFDVFMNLGWHKSLRHALHLMGFSYNYARKPFCTEINDKNSKRIQSVISKLLEYKSER